MTPAIDYFGAIWEKRYFIGSMVKVDLRRRYRRSWLGIGWSLMQPICMTAVFCLVFCPFFNQEISSYAPYVLSGLAFWSYFTGCTTDGCMCYFNGENYIRQQTAPLAIYPLRTVLGMAIHLGIALVVLIALVFVTRGEVPLLTLWVWIPTGVLFFALGWSLAISLGAMNVIFPDTQHLVGVGMQVLFYITPIFYPPDVLRSRGMAWLVDYNPLAAFVQLLREPILDGRVPPPEVFGLAAVATLVAMGLAAITLSKIERKLIFYL